MDLWIKNPCRPTELLLCWESPLTEQDRSKWVVGRISRVGDVVRFAYLNDDEFSQLNFGRTQEKLVAVGYLGYPAFDVAKGPYDRAVLETFMRRLPPKTRSDFHLYLEQFRLVLTGQEDDMSLLGATEARIPSDGFSLINPLDASAEECDVWVEIAGYRHYLELQDRLDIGQELHLIPDPENPYDKNAVRFEVDGALLGHVSRFQAPTVLAWLKRGSVRAFLAKKNGTPDRPKAFAIISYRALKHRVAA